MTPVLPNRMIILLADDDPDDCLLVRDTLVAGGVVVSLRTAGDGEELLNDLQRRGTFNAEGSAPRPGLILLDLSMPKKNGMRAIAEIKADPALRQIPIVVMTTSNQDKDVGRSYDLGASSFVTKPVTFEALVGVMKTTGQYWFEVVESPEP
jgi:CheY-like chemotaxis protein